ncbi:MAG: transcription antitermination factor NusB [Acidithiobacillus caldus]|uniref:transcription antitermination factor NusB n=1 Tax=Acidithiobacillus caldus TaxID=33059 RepID=UPI002815D6FC|nr:transcription antitermination factor NusB [Acidithiobacillus caldus]WMT46655.1 MAG: transcription antitermination factor NusB [Acidithiobacillus caldus]
MAASRRRLAREALLQALYQWQLNPAPCGEIARQFLEDDERLVGADQRFFEDIWGRLCPVMETLDQAIASVILDRRWQDEVSEVERAILRLGAFELREERQTPYRVIINEAVELSKAFGAEQGHRFINGVLDRLAHQWRQAELENPDGDTSPKRK